MKRYIPILFLFLSILGNDGSAQGAHVSPNLEFADQLMAQQNYSLAAKEYLRVYFYDRENSNLEVSRKIALCFDHLGNGVEALKYIRIYNRQNGLTPEMLAEGHYDKLKFLVKYMRSKHAISDYYQIPQSVVDLDYDRYNYYGANIFLLDKDVETARMHLATLSYNDRIDQRQLDNLLTKFQKNLGKGHLTPRLLSAALPGLGQTINGEVRDGINSFALNGSLILLFAHVARSLTLSDAFLSVVPWLGRYYLGGMGNASAASKKNQIKKQTKLLKEINTLLLTAQQSS